MDLIYSALGGDGINGSIKRKECGGEMGESKRDAGRKKSKQRETILPVGSKTVRVDAAMPQG